MSDELLPAARAQGAPLSRGRRLRVLRAEEISGVLDAAVQRALGETLPEQDLAALQRRVRLEFGRLVRERARTVRGLTRRAFLAELEESRDATLASRDRALAELRELRARAADPSGGKGPLSGAEVELYERRIAKLNEALERAEAALRGIRDGSDADLGLASAYRDPQGLDPGADRREQRLALLDEIFEANRRLLRI